MKKILLLSAILIIGICPMLLAQYDTELTGMFNVYPYGGVAIPTGYMQGSPETGGLDMKMGFDFGAGGVRIGEMVNTFSTPTLVPVWISCTACSKAMKPITNSMSSWSALM